MDCELNFREICRCCTRTESGMTSIFDENVHSIYPAVKVMLNSIASLNVLEYDELPWLVCKLCQNSIQHAYTFIQHLNHIDVQLRQILLARRKEEDTLPQFATLKNEPEHPEVVPVPEIEEEYNLQLQEQEQTEPLATATKEDFNKNDSFTFAEENSDLDQELDTPEKVNEPDIENEQNSPGDNLLKVLYVDDMGVDEDYHEDDENDNSSDISADSSESESNHDAAEDPKSQTKGRKTTSPAVSVFKCNLCEYSCKCIGAMNRHLQSHSKEKQFECSKCNVSFRLKHNMLHHLRNCNGKIGKLIHRKNRLQQVISLQDLKHPLQMEKYYTVTPIDAIGRKDLWSMSEYTVLKCKLCAYTTAIMYNLKLHLYTHCNDKPFTCSKCKRTFTQRGNMLVHWRNCNGKMRYVREPKPQNHQMIPLQDLTDPVKMKKYYIRTAKLM